MKKELKQYMASIILGVVLKIIMMAAWLGIFVTAAAMFYNQPIILCLMAMVGEAFIFSQTYKYVGECDAITEEHYRYRKIRRQQTKKLKAEVIRLMNEPAIFKEHQRLKREA
jgi:hypothetical protein